MKTYLVVVESVYDCEANHEYYSFINKAEARKKLEEVKAEMLNVLDGWEQEEDGDGDGFQMWEDGYYASNHCRVEVLEVEVQGTIGQLDYALKAKEREEFREVAARLPYKENEDGVDEYVIPFDKDEDDRTVIICNSDDGPIDLRVDSIKFHNGVYELCGVDNHDNWCEYAFWLDDVATGHLSFLTASLK